MGRISRGLITGLVAGTVLAVLLVAGAFAYEAYRGSGKVDDPTKVVIVFAIAGEDGGPLAHTAVVVQPGSGASYYVAETSATVSLPGVTDTRLASVYAFEGAAGVAAAHDGGDLRRGTAWVDVPPAAWSALLGEGVDVVLSDSFEVFDGEEFYTFDRGRRRIRGQELRAFANGIEYLPASERRSLREAIARASLSALLSSAGPPNGVTTNLTTQGWERLVREVRGGDPQPRQP